MSTAADIPPCPDPGSWQPSPESTAVWSSLFPGEHVWMKATFSGCEMCGEHYGWICINCDETVDGTYFTGELPGVKAKCRYCGDETDMEYDPMPFRCAMCTKVGRK